MQKMGNEIKREFNCLWDDTLNKVRAYIYCICRDSSQVDDITQDCYLRALKSWKKFKGNGTRQAWLFAIARNACVDSFRAKKSKACLSLDALEIIPGTKTKKQNQYDIEAVWNTIQKMQPEYKEVLYLRFAGDLNYAEMAQALNVPLGTIRSRLHRAIKMLQEKYQGI